MSEEAIREIKDVITILLIFKARNKKLSEELRFLKYNWEKARKNSIFLGAAKRLEHEVMFLCIEAYSLHQGIEKKRSLYSKIIKQNGKSLSKVDKSSAEKNSFIWLGIESEDKALDFTSEEKESLMKAWNERAYNERQKVRDGFGIASQNHDDLDEWLSHILDDDTLLKLGSYRDRFAHRLDSLKNLKMELKAIHPDGLAEILSTVEIVLDAYICCFRKMILYTTSEHFSGMSNFCYESLSRIMSADQKYDS